MRFRPKRRSIVSAVLVGGVAWLAAGCGIIGPKGCPSDLRWRVQPESAVIEVGERLQVSARAFGCAGTEELPVDMRWSSSDESILEVGELDGTVLGVSTGSAEIVGVDLGRYGIGPVSIEVQVVSE